MVGGGTLRRTENISNMAPSQTERPDRGLNLPNTKSNSTQNTNEEKHNELIKSTFDLLEKGEKEIKFDDRHKDVILILGNTGSGKSTFTQWIAGDNTKMISKETKEGNGEYIIEDHNRIGTSTLKSKTVFPELVIDRRTNSAYYDCPGFSDTQGTSHDIATTYFIKKVIEYTASVKLIFTISHPSVRKGVDRHNFMKLIRHITDFMKDIEKFRHSIGIVVTKIDNQYIKRGRDFVLVDDEKVIASIADFLQEAKRYFGDKLRSPNISKKDKYIYENGINFVDVVLEKDGEVYQKIGLFRRPDQPGPISEIPLLQKSKEHIEKMVYEKLNFTAKNNEDFGFTVSEKTKNDIHDIVEDINTKLWSRISNIAKNIQEYYQNLVEEIQCKVRFFITEVESIDICSSRDKTLANTFNNGKKRALNLVNKMKNITDPTELAIIINSTVSKLDINLPKDDVLFIVKQGEYFSFLRTISDKTLSSKPWGTLFENVESFIFDSKTAVLHDADLAMEKINNRMQLNLNYTLKEMQEEYIKKVKSIELQKLPDKLNRDSANIFELTEELKNGTTIEGLLNTIQNIANNLDVSSSKENLENISNKEKCLQFLAIIREETFNFNPTMLISPFKNMVSTFYEYQTWYAFLEDLHNKFSQHSIQKERQIYNVADLEDWGQSGKPQGIAVTSNTFERFLNKIENLNVTEHSAIKNLTTTGLQIEELNEILTITLKHRPIVRCSHPYLLIKGRYVSLNETMQNAISNSDTNNSCTKFIASSKYNLIKVYAFNTVFVDINLQLAGKGISVAIIAPKWEVVGSRSIELDGADGPVHENTKARNGARPGSNGVNGAPGIPGKSGESFFGIGVNFVSGGNLKITSKGGKGGRGQDGGDGAVGVSGQNAATPSDSDPPCENGYVNGFSCEKIEKKRKGTQFLFIGAVVQSSGTSTDKSFKIFGKPGGRGGTGGNGGKGGKGGHPGSITIIELVRPSEIRSYTDWGREGEIGKAGTGAGGGKHGDDIIADWHHWSPDWMGALFGQKSYSKWTKKETIIHNGKGLAGRAGLDGVNDKGIQLPEPGNGICKLSNVVNEYKNLLRESINISFEKHSLLQFLNQLDTSNDVEKLYDAIGLINDFLGLENQYHRLRDQLNFALFYHSLQKRVREFLKFHTDGETSSDYKTVLSYLYTATLSRIYNLKESSESNLIIDINGYLNLVIDNIKTLQNLQSANSKADVINKYKENYKSDIEKKIDEAKTFIKKQIRPEIDNINKQIDDQVDSLIEETIAMKKQAEKDREELSRKKKELEQLLPVKGFLSCFQIIGGVVSFLGPIGAIAGTVIEATSTVIENLALSNRQQSLSLPTDVALNMKSLGDQIRMMRNQKVAHLKKMLDNVSEEINKNPEVLSDMAGKISNIKEKFKKATEEAYDSKQIKILEGELKQELERKGKDLKVNSSNKKSMDALKAIGKITQIAKFGSLLLSIYDNIKEDEEKINAINDALEKNEDKIKMLRDYEENIYDTIIPMLTEMEENMKELSNKLGTRSQVALDVTKWQVQSTLKDMKLQMQRLTEGFQVKEDLARCVEKLDEVMTTMINIYDRIHSFQDQQNLANYIADISSVSASSINIENQQLVQAVNRLESVIRSNIVLKQYKSAIDAFKQWVFPFSDHYMEKNMLPSQLELNASIRDVVQNAITEIETMKQKLDLYNTSVKKNDHYLQYGEFDSRYVSSEPFFVWKNEEYRNVISDLLSGKEVVLKADVKASAPGKDAIKFNLIDFHFRSKNETSQSLLTDTLKGFYVTATHFGNSYYRYADKIYLITSDSVQISFSLEQNDVGVPIQRNAVYEKLRSGDLRLSPYTLWKITMHNTTKKHSFLDLERFKDEIDLELSGFGSYVDNNVFELSTSEYKSFIVYNNTNLPAIRSETTDFNECTGSKNRVARSPKEFAVEDNYLTNGAVAGKSSAINFLLNLLKTYFSSNAITYLNQIFSKEHKSARNHDAYPESSERRNTDLRMAGRTKTDATCAEDILMYKVQSNSFNFGSTNGTDSDSYLKTLLCNQYGIRNNRLADIPELNSSLLLADLISRTIFGNKYKLGVHESLISPREVIKRKIDNGEMLSESAIKQQLQRLLSKTEDVTPRSFLCKIQGCFQSTLQFFGLARKDDNEECVQDIRNLFA